MKEFIDSTFLFSSIMMIFLGVGGFLFHPSVIVYCVAWGYFAVLASVWLTMTMKEE